MGIKDIIYNFAERIIDKQDKMDEINPFRLLLVKKYQQQQNEFKKVMNFAAAVINKTSEYNSKYSEHPIYDVIRILAKNIQYSCMRDLIKKGGSTQIDYYDIFFDDIVIDGKKTWIYDIISKVEKNNYKLNLRKDIVIPNPWNYERLINNISTIGKDRYNGPWNYHRTNHNTILWLPLGVTFVDGGNHSISVGLIQGEGVLEPHAVYDISKLYDYIYCDGRYFRYINTHEILQEVKDIDFACIYEIGRLIIKNRITFSDINN